MAIGAPPTTRLESLLQRVQLSVAVSRRERLESGWRLDLCSPFWRLYRNDSTGAYVVYDGIRQNLRPREIYLIPAWLRFQTGLTQPVTQDYIHFYFTGFPPGLMREWFDRPLNLKPDSLLKGLLFHWVESLREPEETELCTFAWANALVNAAVATALSKLPEDRQWACNRWLATSTEVRPALECIDMRLADPPGNGELASLCHVSQDHFIRLFREAVGMTPARYGLERRIAIAAQWLTGSSRTIDEISFTAGFSDRFHFSKVFKDRLGLAPAAYRKMHLQRG